MVSQLQTIGRDGSHGERLPLPYKPDFVPARERVTVISLCDYYPGVVAGGPPFPCSVLHHAGFAVPPGLPRCAVGSYPTVSPLPVSRGAGPSAVCFLLHFPSGRLAASVPRFRVARCPVVSGLSSIPTFGKAGTATVRGAAGTTLRFICLTNNLFSWRCEFHRPTFGAS